MSKVIKGSNTKTIYITVQPTTDEVKGKYTLQFKYKGLSLDEYQIICEAMEVDYASVDKKKHKFVITDKPLPDTDFSKIDNNIHIRDNKALIVNLVNV